MLAGAHSAGFFAACAGFAPRRRQEPGHAPGFFMFTLSPVWRAEWPRAAPIAVAPRWTDIPTHRRYGGSNRPRANRTLREGAIRLRTLQRLEFFIAGPGSEKSRSQAVPAVSLMGMGEILWRAAHPTPDSVENTNETLTRLFAPQSLPSRNGPTCNDLLTSPSQIGIGPSRKARNRAARPPPGARISVAKASDMPRHAVLERES